MQSLIFVTTVGLYFAYLYKHESRSRLKRQGIFILYLTLSVICVSFGFTQSYAEEISLETSLANAYVYITTKTIWPPNSNEQQDFIFCVNQDHSLFDAFSKLLPKRKISGRNVKIRFFEEKDVESQQSCQVIALGKNQSFNKTIISNVKGTPVLIISHEIDTTKDGGIVFIAYDKKLEPPKINFKFLESSGLKMDAAVLNLSKKRWGE